VGLVFDVFLRFWENGNRNRNQRGLFSKFYRVLVKNGNHEYGDDNGFYHLMIYRLGPETLHGIVTVFFAYPTLP